MSSVWCTSPTQADTHTGGNKWRYSIGGHVRASCHVSEQLIGLRVMLYKHRPGGNNRNAIQGELINTHTVALVSGLIAQLGMSSPPPKCRSSFIEQCTTWTVVRQRRDRLKDFLFQLVMQREIITYTSTQGQTSQ